MPRDKITPKNLDISGIKFILKKINNARHNFLFHFFYSLKKPLHIIRCQIYLIIDRIQIIRKVNENAELVHKSNKYSIFY